MHVVKTKLKQNPNSAETRKRNQGQLWTNTSQKEMEQSDTLIRIFLFSNQATPNQGFMDQRQTIPTPVHPNKTPPPPASFTEEHPECCKTLSHA